MCWVIPPCSPETTFESLRESSKDVFPWSTCPIIVTTGGLFFTSPSNFSFDLIVSIDGASSKIGLWPNSLTIYSAVSLSILWFIVATTFMLNKNLIISLDFSAILLESSWIVICSGIFTSLITFLNSFFSSPSGFFFSFSLARLTDAKLLCLISISSTLSARETVNLKSRLSTGPFSFNLLLPAGLLSFLMKSFVACCSMNFLAKFFFFKSELVFTPGFCVALLNVLFCLKGFFFSTENDFFPDDVIELVSIFFFKLEEIVSVFFLSFSITLLVRYLSRCHYKLICFFSWQRKFFKITINSNFFSFYFIITAYQFVWR